MAGGRTPSLLGLQVVVVVLFGVMAALDLRKGDGVGAALALVLAAGNVGLALHRLRAGRRPVDTAADGGHERVR
jgi:hypothetical protein